MWSYFGRQDGWGFGDNWNTHQGNRRRNGLQATPTFHQ